MSARDPRAGGADERAEPNRQPGSLPRDGGGPDLWRDQPDAWDRADREWREKWERREEDDPIEPPPADYRPTKASARSVASSYKEGMTEAGPYLTIGLQIAMSMLFFVGVGWALDEWAGTGPWGILVGTVLGFVGVMAFVVRMAKEANTPRR